MKRRNENGMPIRRSDAGSRKCVVQLDPEGFDEFLTLKHYWERVEGRPLTRGDVLAACVRQTYTRLKGWERVPTPIGFERPASEEEANGPNSASAAIPA